jgi:hypothetical protein
MLRCDGEATPLAVLSTQPEFSWQLTAASPALHGVAQSAYRIQVAASDRDFSNASKVLWDSGTVTSAATSGIRYAGPRLEPQHSYAWRVALWDERGRATGWSATEHWTQAPVWRAAWIAAHKDDSRSVTEPMPLFRKTFAIEHPIARAILYASGLGQDELRINGLKVGSDELTPGWSDYRKTVYYDAYDVSTMLHPGANAVGVLLGNGMYRVLKAPGRYTKFVGSYGSLRCTLQLHIEFQDGSTAEILSDGTWKTTPGPTTFSHTYGGEDYDARLEPKGWDLATFNDAGWQAVSVVSGPGGALSPEVAPPIRVAHVYQPVKVTEPKPGVRVYDLGQNFAGWPSIIVSGPAGASVKLIPGELLNKDGFVTQRSSGGPQWFTYTLRGADREDRAESWYPRFSYYGFRYVQAETMGGARIVQLHGEAVHSSSVSIGSFESSDVLLNRIHALIVRAIENNAVSLFTDCPQREKLGWLEQTHLLASSLQYDFDFAKLYAATARNIADAQQHGGPKAGMVPEIAPQYVVFDPKYDDFNDSPEWGSAAILAPWYSYQRTGNKIELAAQYSVMCAYADYLATRVHDGILDYGLGDWYDIGPGEPGLAKLTTAGVTATAIYYQDLTVLGQIAALLGKEDESRRYAGSANAVRSAFNARFFHPDTHTYDKGSQTALAMPLALGIVPDSERGAVLNALVADIRAHGNHVTAGDIGFHYVVVALLDGGRSDVLYDMLERTDAPSYGYQLMQGATALTEAWDANPAHSQDHFMLGDAEEWFYRGLGGIQLDLARQGADQLVVRPVLTGKLTWVKTQYQSALGLIRSDWQRMGTTTVYNITVPPNRTAKIVLEPTAPESLVVNNRSVDKADGVLAIETDRARIELLVNSGTYQIHATRLP